MRMAGRQRDIAWLIWIFTAVCSGNLGLRSCWCLPSACSGGNAAINTPPLDTALWPRRTRVISVATALTAVAVIALSVLSYLTDRSLATPGAAPLSVTLIGAPVVVGDPL